MEYNLDSVAPPKKPNPIKRFWNFATSPQYSRTFSILVVLLIAAAIPLTAFIAQQQTKTKQQAAGFPEGKVEFVDANGNSLPAAISDPKVSLKITLPDNWQLPTTGQLQNPHQNMSVVPKVYAQAACPDAGQPGTKTTCGYSTYDTCQDDRGNPESDPNFCKGGATRFTCWYSQNVNCTATLGGVFPFSCSACPALPTPTPTTIPSQPTPTPNPQQLGAPALIFPASGQTVASGQISFSWSDVSGAASYNVRVRDNTNPDARHGAGGFSNNCPGDPMYVCTNGWTSTGLNITVEPGHSYTWWVYAAKDANGNNPGPQSSAFDFGVSGSAQPTATPTPPSSGTKTLTRLNIANVNEAGETTSIGQSGGSGPQLLTQLAQFTNALSGKYLWRLNSLNANETSATRIVNVGFTSGDTLLTAQVKITLTRPGVPPTLPPPGETGVCRDLKPDQTSPPSTDDPTKYIWKVQPDPNSCSTQPSCYNGENVAIYHDKCPKNDSQPGFVNPDTSRWCYGFQGPNGETGDTSFFRCLKLEYIGSPSAPTPTALPPGVPASTPTPISTPPAGQTPSSTPVPPGQPTPTATPIPTPTSSVTPPPAGPASVTFSVALAGIGQRGATGTSQATSNPNPVQTRRDATLYLYALGDDPTGDSTGARAKYIVSQPQALVYDGSGKFVATNFNLGSTFLPGQYQVFVRTQRYLRKRIPGVQTINAGTNTISQQATLPLGDANNDNKLNTLDYQEYRSCLNQQTTTCMAKADFNDDGRLDNDDKHGSPSFRDHALFTDQFAIIDGD